MPAVRNAQGWVAVVQMHVLRGELAAAQSALTEALAEHPASVELRRAQAGVFEKTGRHADAESRLRSLLAEDAGDAASAFALARMLKAQARMAAAAQTLRTCFLASSTRHGADLSIHAIELLDDCGRKADAAAIAHNAISASPADARLHAYAGMLEVQLGAFERARQHYAFALEHDERAWEWHAPLGMATAQRYADDAHPDFALFRAGLQRPGLSGMARAELQFALGKAHDDIGHYAQAARNFRDGNAIAHSLKPWPRKAWRRAIEARLAAGPLAHRLESTQDFTPVFIVGMPRSGTTLLAELLSRHPEACNRGESPWIAQLAGEPALAGNPRPEALRRAAETYARHARQDDAPGAHWLIDKQPLNFRYVDLMLAMFPNARIVHCERCPRDTALSLWSQCFLEDVQGYATDFADIAVVMHDCDRLMAHWRKRFPDSISSVRYEQLVASPTTVVEELARWIGLPRFEADLTEPAASSTPSISTASLWQARQPVSTRSIGRWRHYAAHVPELLTFPERP